MFVKYYKQNGFKMPLIMKNINSFIRLKKNGSVVTTTHAITHLKHLAEFGAQYTECIVPFQYTPRIY